MRAGRTLRNGLRLYVLPIGCGGAWPGIFNLIAITAAHRIPVLVYALALRYEPLAMRVHRVLERIARRIFAA